MSKRYTHRVLKSLKIIRQPFKIAFQYNNSVKVKIFEISIDSMAKCVSTQKSFEKCLKLKR